MSDSRMNQWVEKRPELITFKGCDLDSRISRRSGVLKASKKLLFYEIRSKLKQRNLLPVSLVEQLSQNARVASAL